MRAATLNDDPSLSREGTITRLAYSCLLMVGINSGWLGPFLPQISHTAHLPIERAGLIVSASAAGYFISVLIAGEIHQQLSAQKILVGAMVLFTAGLAGLAAAPGLAGLLCAGFVIGLANGGIDIGANALIVELNRERLASALNYLHVLFGVGALLGPLIVSAAFATRVPYWWIFGGGAIACAAIGFRLVVTPAAEVRVAPIAGDDSGFIPMLSRPLIWVISAVMFLYVGAEVGIGAWLFLYLRMAGALGPMIASSGVSLYWLGLVCGRAFGGRLGHRIALPQFTMMASALSAAALVILIVAPTAGVLAASAVFLIGFGYGPVFPEHDRDRRGAVPGRSRQDDVDRSRGRRARRNRRALDHGPRDRRRKRARQHGSRVGLHNRDGRAVALAARVRAPARRGFLSLIARRQEGGNLAIVGQSADGNVGAVRDSLRLDQRAVDSIEVPNES